jgi:hypothetical protein
MIFYDIIVTALFIDESKGNYIDNNKSAHNKWAEHEYMRLFWGNKGD